MPIKEDLGPGGIYSPAPTGAQGASGVGFTPRPRSGYAVGPALTATTTVSPINGQSIAAPFVIPAAGLSVSALVVEITAAGASGALARPTFWADDGTGYPGAVLWDCPDASRIDASTAGVKSLSASISFASKSADYVVWGAVTTQGAPATVPTYRGCTGVTPFVLTPPGNSAAIAGGYSRTGIAGAASSWSGVTLAVSQPVQLRLVCA